jgi:hypothetical protein
MRHLALLSILLTSLATLRAGEAPRWAQMDYGPAFGCSLQVGSEYVLRALIVRLDRERQIHVAYDLETMRVAAMWTGGFIDGKGVVFNGEHHAQPKPVGTMVFSNPVGPGWAGRDGGLADPRPLNRAAYNVPAGGSEMTREGQPMPKEWIDYRGYHLHGDDVVLSYRVNGCAVLERPALLAGTTTLVRELIVAPTAGGQRVHLGGKGIQASHLSVAGARLELAGDERVLVLEPSGQARRVVVALGGSPLLSWEAPVERTAGGPARWPRTITTRGVAGTGDGAYVVDTLTAPDDNPWKSWMRFGGIDFFPDGKRAALCTWSGDVWIVGGIDDGLEELTWKRHATGLHEPLGLRIVGDRIVLTCRNAIMRLHDLDADGEADFYEAFNSDIHLTRHFHEFALDLQNDAAGNLYFAKGGTPGRGGPDFDLWSIHNGGFFKLSPDGTKLDIVARGLRAPNGIGIGPHSEMTSGDNQGSWVPVCPINRIRPGGFVGIPDGVPGAVKPTRRDPPICWLPYDVDNSSGCQVWVPDGRWGPFAGRMLHLSYGKSSLFSVMTQEIGEVMQGAVVRFPLAFATGIMRARFNQADGQLYVCGLRGWQTTAARDGAFQRVRFTGQPVRMPSAWAVTREGLELSFTVPLDRATVEDVGNYALQQFNVVWSAAYGSPELSLADPMKKGRDRLEVAAAKLAADGRTISLSISGITPVNCQGITLKIAAADGTPIAATVWGTVNVVP